MSHIDAHDDVQRRAVQQRIKAREDAREHIDAAVAKVGALSAVAILASVLVEESRLGGRCWIATLADSVRCAGEVAERAQRRRDARFGLGHDG